MLMDLMQQTLELSDHTPIGAGNGAEALQRATADAPPKFAEAVANILTRSRQLQDLVTSLLRPGAGDDLTETQEKALRHDLRGHAAYVIGMCHLWQKQAAKFGLERFLPRLDEL